MEIEKKNLKGSIIEFKISIEWDVVKGSLKDAYDGIQRYARTFGFRKGKIPRPIFEARFSKEAEDRAIEHLITKATKETLDNEKIEPLTGPFLAEVNFKKENPLSFKIMMEVMPSFEIPNYNDIKLSYKKIKIDEKEIEKHLEMLMKEKGELKEKDGKIKKGDIAVVDLISYPPSGKPTEHSGLYIEIGASVFPEKLENELLNLCKGDEKEFVIEMPEDTNDEKLAGKNVKFEANVLGVKERILPKLDDDFAKKVGDFKNLKELKARIKDNLTKIEEEREKESLKEQMISELLKRIQFDAPESLIIGKYKEMFHTFLYNLERENMQFERFLSLQNKTADAFRSELRNEAEKNVKTFLILEKIAKAKNIVVSDSEYEEWVERNFSNDAIEKALSPEKREAFKKDLIIEKTLEFLIKR
ncbi:MAG: trigger factor [bacterium]